MSGRGDGQRGSAKVIPEGRRKQIATADVEGGVSPVFQVEVNQVRLWSGRVRYSRNFHNYG